MLEISPVTFSLSYQRTVLYGNEFFEIVSCSWVKNSVSPLHSHGWSQCLVLVQEGRFENRAELGLKSEVRMIEAGQVISTPQGVDHEIRCLSESGKTLHVYVPKISAFLEEEHFSSMNLEDLRSKLDLELGPQGTSWQQLEKALGDIQTHSVSTHSPYFMNQLFAGVFPETLAAEKILAQTRTTMATFEASPAFTTMELEIIDKLGQIIGWPVSQRDGIGVPGGSAANMMAVHCARQKYAPTFRKQGSQGEKFRIFCSTEAHYSMKKTCLVTGLGTDACIEIETDHKGRMLASKLREKIRKCLDQKEIPLLVCATAGTTVLGAFDPIDDLADVCEEFKIWLHVDGAWGAPALFSSKARDLMSGVERADSLTFDAHKLFGSNLTCSFFLTRNKGILQEANDVAGGDYIFHSDEVVQDRGRLSWQCGRGAEALSFWALWKNQGSQGLGSFVDRLFSLRDDCVQWIEQQPRLQLISKPDYLNICVRVLTPSGESDPQWSRRVREQLKQDNIAFVNFSKNEDGTFLRLILAHPKLEMNHLRDILRGALEVR